MSEIYYGVVENRDADPKKLGRCKVRVVGVHSEDSTLLKTKDLPWAYPMMPVHSASMSGIGYSPTGIVEGTWVVITFRDKYNQQPVIIGTLGGIPIDETPESETKITYTKVEQDTLKDSSGNTVLDGFGNPVLTGTPKEVTVTEIAQPPSDIKKISQMKVSDAGIQFIMDQESLCSLSPVSKIFTKKAVDPLTPIFSYLDSNGEYSIGYGNQFMPDGSRVKKDTIILAKDAKSLLNKHVTDNIEKYLSGVITAPLTQQMYDALIDMAYNAGGPALAKSSIITSINTQKYNDAAALIPLWRITAGGKANSGLVNRRLREQTLFLSGGIPNSSFSYVDKTNNTPQEEDRLQKEREAAGVVEPPPTSTGYVDPAKKTGFRDPSGVYPINALKGEPDTNRLARGDRIYETIVFAKEAARAKRIRKPFWKKLKREWSQPDIPYNAAYPHNQTRTTESGHVEEWDDTKGSERIHKYHKAGTYEEIDANGTRVTRIVGDSYEILERNGNLVVRGSISITVQGNADIRVENDANMEILGDLKTQVVGKWEHKSKDDINWSTEGKFNLLAKGGLALTSEKTAVLESIEALQIRTGKDLSIGATGTITEVASTIYLDKGDLGSPLPTMPDDWEEPTGVPKFGKLVVIDRTVEASAQYESPHEGSSTEFLNQQVARGEFSMPDASAPVQETGENATSSASKATDTETDPESIPMTAYSEISLTDIGEISPIMRLSPNYRLIDILGNSEKGKVPTDSFGGKSQVRLTQKQVIGNLKWLANNVMEPIRAQFPNVVPTSSWRSNASNAGLIGASSRSDHLIAGAIDMVFTGYSNTKLITAANTIASMLPTFNQIILEYKGNSMWIHVSVFAPGTGINNAKQRGTMDINKGGKWNNGFILRENVK
jgi:GH24 family phage-related lysozyme (muramidase)